jgi:hypothetical protein
MAASGIFQYISLHLIRALQLQQKLDRKTSIPHWQETRGYGSRLIVFLNLFLRKLKISDRVGRKSIDAEDAAQKIQKRF